MPLQTVLIKSPALFTFRSMESYELLRDVFENSNPKTVAAELGLSLSMIYKWAEPPNEPSGTANPLDRVAGLLRCTNDPRLVQWLCERAGGFFISNPKAMWNHPFYLVPATNRIVQEFADLLSVVAAAAADNQITKKEAAGIRTRWEQLKSVTEGFVRCCEDENFMPLQKSVAPATAKPSAPK